MEEWFVQESPAYILEQSSDWDSKETGIYRRLSADVAFRAHILPLLTVSEDSIYMIANSATITYGIVDCYIVLELTLIRQFNGRINLEKMLPGASGNFLPL